MKKNITDKNILYLRKVLQANLYWYTKTPCANERTIECSVDRMLSVITRRFDLSPKKEKISDQDLLDL